MSAQRKIPEPDAFDEETFPYGVAPGGNKFGILRCPACSKEASRTPRNDLPRAFLFKDELSAREYRISGLCQACQDGVFG